MIVGQHLKNYSLELQTEWKDSSFHSSNNDDCSSFITALAAVVQQQPQEIVNTTMMTTTKGNIHKNNDSGLILCTEQSLPTMNYKICLRDINVGWTTREFHGHTKWIHSIQTIARPQKRNLDLKGCFFLSCSEDCTIKLWNTNDSTHGRCIVTFHGHTKSVTSITNTICVYNRSTTSKNATKTTTASSSNTEEKEDGGHNDVDENSYNDPYDEIFLSGSEDRTIKLWNINTTNKKKRCVFTYKGHTEAVNAVTWITSNDDESENNQKKDAFFVSGSEDHVLKLWNLSTNSCIYTNDNDEHKGL